MKKYSNSIRYKLVSSDLLRMIPLIVLFFILFFSIFISSRREMNKSRFDLLDERSGGIARNNSEIMQIMTAVSVNSDINRIVSQREAAEGYDYVKNYRMIQNKLLDVSELFFEKQYGLLLFCENGTSYYQSSLILPEDSISMNALEQESWYQKIEKQSSAYVLFLPWYESRVLQECFPKDTLFAIQYIYNNNSGRRVGLLILAVKQAVWNEDPESHFADNSLIIDSHGKVISPVESELYDTNISEYGFYNNICTKNRALTSGTINGKKYSIYSTDISATDWKLLLYEPAGWIWSVYMILLSILAFVTLVVIALIVIFNCNFIDRRMKRINEDILAVSEGNLHLRITEKYEIEFEEMCVNFNTMLDRVESLMAQLEKKEEEKYVLECQSLQLQINSHFFNNTLVSIRFMIQNEEYEAADHTLIVFSRLLRKSFTDSRRIITVGEELETVREYLELMSLRDPESFSWTMEIDENVRDCAVLKNTVQPLVENSITHGFNMKEKAGMIRIHAYHEKDAVIIEVEDDGVGADLEKIRASIQNKQLLKPGRRFSQIGLSNTQMRINRNFGEEFGLAARYSRTGGIIMTMKIPSGIAPEEVSEI